jgi:hypothetical protein
MRIYLGIDDTDVAGADRGTGKLARMLAARMPHEVRVWGVVRQQLPVLDGIPYTSQNSSACLILEADSAGVIPSLVEVGAAHLAEHFVEGSDPGLCVVAEDAPAARRLLDFGRRASSRIVTQAEARAAAGEAHLSGHGGTEDGIIGAAAGVGLTISGWSGRFIQFDGLRDLPRHVTVGELEDRGVRTLSVDRNALFPDREDEVDTRNWLRPRLWGFGPVLPVEQVEHGKWRSIAGKNKKGHRRVDTVSLGVVEEEAGLPEVF